MLKTRQMKILQLDESKKTNFGYPAASIDQSDLLVKKVPEQIQDEIPTMNRMGYMKVDLDEFSEEFIGYSVDSDGLVLELGCAYGFVVQKVLKAGGQIIASDLSREHLTVLIKDVPKKLLKNLYLLPGYFPDDINFPRESLSAVLTSRMLHFLDGDTIERGLRKIYNWLIPNGKLFFISVTPHHAALRDSFLEKYLARVLNGEEWPGVIENQWEINPTNKEYVEPYLNVFDVAQLEELLPKYGFKIEKIGLFDYPYDVDSDGKGHIGFVATKVQNHH
jgi:SAM-dependent methyltransferase